VVLPLGQAIEDRPSLTVQPLEPADLPASVYMLVDKTVELDIKPLRDLPELGALPDGEGDRQALVVYANPRQAKRYCGRNQRVIKVPDSGVLARTAPYLLSQGVTRLVVEGALYSLPGS
jgi:riboflavin biosynthesis pyrimidine reductase